MFIEPMQIIENFNQINKIGNNVNMQEGSENTLEQGVQIPFKTMFQDALKDVISTDEQVNIDAEMLASGQSDNLHQYSIDIAKAQLSVDLLVEMRNKALDAYSEVMRMSI